MPEEGHYLAQIITPDDRGVYWLFCLRCRTLAQREAWYEANPICRRSW